MDRRSGYAEVEGGRLYYETVGAGRPVVLLHGFSFDLRMWDAQVEPFGARYRVIRYDTRGHGRSSAPTTAPYRDVDDLTRLLGHLGVEQAHVVGLSRGGGIAVDFALAYPEMVNGLVLVDTTLNGFEWSTASTDEWRRVYRAARETGVEAGRALWLADPMFEPSLANADAAVGLREMIRDYSGWHWLNRDPGQAVEPAAIHQLGAVAASTLVMVGEHDLPDFQRVADVLVEGIAAARKVVVEGVGHIPPMEDPTRFNRCVLRFLAEVDERGGRLAARRK